MCKRFDIIDLYKSILPSGALFPTSTNFDFWDDVYPANKSAIDREFARRFAHFKYFDFMEADELSDAVTNFKADVLSILTFNEKRYAEMYRVFLVEDEDDPITYNYDMTETTGAQHSETEYGGTSFTKGQETFTKGEETFTKGLETFTKGSQENTDGAVTNTHNVAPMNSTTPIPESSDAKTAQTITDGQRQDTYSQRQDTNGQRQDTNGQRTDTTLAHTDQYDSDEWTLTRKGNIGVQTAGDILRIHTQYWTEIYKFLQLIFDDIAKQLLLVGDC